jgi:hypothetical protein
MGRGRDSAIEPSADKFRSKHFMRSGMFINFSEAIKSVAAVEEAMRM